MSSKLQVKNALISVYYKDNLAKIVDLLNELNVNIFSTGGTRTFIEERNIPVIAVENLTSYPSILGGRVKTLHPKIFGGILARRENEKDLEQLQEYEIPPMDLVIVDLYPFEETLNAGASEVEIIEKIDIGGISLIRAAAKNYKDVLIVSSRTQYNELYQLLHDKKGSEIEDRKAFALKAFETSSHYDSAIRNYFSGENSLDTNKLTLRYGENPHQKAYFEGDFNAAFDKLHGKELSYNNLLDVDAAVSLMEDFNGSKPTFAILKHNNACGIASRNTLEEAYKAALAADPISAFGGILICNSDMNVNTATLVNELFCEVVIAPSYSDQALEILKSKKNRILLLQKNFSFSNKQLRSILNGKLVQDRDIKTENESNFTYVTNIKPSDKQIEDLIFAAKVVKHTKSNAIVLVKDQQLLASGTGQTSRVDALQQAITKAKFFTFDLNAAAMASDAFFPFPDCVEIADKAGINAVIQPGGSIKDQQSIDYCNKHAMVMVTTGTRHFKH